MLLCFFQLCCCCYFFGFSLACSFDRAIENYNEAIILSPDDDHENLSIYYSNRAACYLLIVSQLKYYATSNDRLYDGVLVVCF